MMSVRDKHKHRWFSEHILQKATGFTAKEVKEMINRPNFKWKATITVEIVEGRIISLNSQLLE